MCSKGLNGRGAGYHPLLWALMSPPWDQAPMKIGKLRPKVRSDRLKAMGSLSQHELPPGWGCCPQEGWSWGLSQDLRL